MNSHSASQVPTPADALPPAKSSSATPAATPAATRPATPPALVAAAIATAVTLGGSLLRLLVLAIMARANDDSLWGLLNKWDAEHYVNIAKEGYFREVEFAFFPGLPGLMRLLGYVGVNLSVAGIVISVVATGFMAAGVMALARRMGAGVVAQAASAVVVTCAPMSMVLVMPYTEALFGALAVWALVALQDRAWVRAGALVFLLSFVRLTAIDMIAVFAVWVLLYGRREWRAWAALVASAVPLLGFIAWASAQVEGGYFALQDRYWHSGFDFGASTLEWVWTTLTTSNDAAYLLSTFCILGVIGGLWLAFGRLPGAVWLFCLTLAANVLLSDGIMHSRPRLLLPTALLLLPWVIAGFRQLRRTKAWILVALWALWGTWVGGLMLAVFEWAI